MKESNSNIRLFLEIISRNCEVNFEAATYFINDCELQIISKI